MGEPIVLNDHRSTLLRHFQPVVVTHARTANLLADDRGSSIEATETIPNE